MVLSMSTILVFIFLVIGVVTAAKYVEFVYYIDFLLVYL